MPQLRPVPRAEASEATLAVYDASFGPGIDPVASPGTATGIPGDWQTVWAQAPGIFKAFSAYPFAGAKIDIKLRELAVLRTGYARGSQFVFSQHSKSARDRAGLPQEKIDAIPYWSMANCYSDIERAVLGYTDMLVLEGGRVPDEVFKKLKTGLTEEMILELSYYVKMYDLHASCSRALKNDYDNVEDRVKEIPAPKTRRAQNHLDPSSWNK